MINPRESIYSHSLSIQFDDKKELEEIDHQQGKSQKKLLILHSLESTIKDMKESQEASNRKYIEWKIEKYKTILDNLHRNIENYFKNTDEGVSIQRMYERSSSTELKEWLKKLLPIFKTFVDFKTQEIKFNSTYLSQLRNEYQQGFLEPLREAVWWTQKCPKAKGVEHIQAICNIFYTQTDLTACCLKIVKEIFCQLGREASEGKPIVKKYQLSDPNLILIRDLEAISHLIKQVPDRAKASRISQMKNSLIGHLNGISTDFPFDPNLHDNIVHKIAEWTIIHPDKTTQTVIDVAMGAQIIGFGDTAYINPELWGFQNYNREHSLKHLYVNHLSFQSKSRKDGDESLRCRALHDQLDLVITLAQDTPFYLQEEEDPIQDLDSQVIKEKLLSQIFDQKPTQVKPFIPLFMIDSNEKIQFYRNYYKTVFDQIHQQQFWNVEKFREEQKKTFFHFCYAKIKERAESIKYYGDFGYSVYWPRADKFKEELIAQLFNGSPEQTGHYIPDKLICKLELKRWSWIALSSIHNSILGDCEFFTLPIRKTIIDLMHILLVIKIISDFKINTYNKSCRDRTDRGLTSDAELLAYLFIVNEIEMNPETKDFFEAMLFSRPIMVKKRTIIDKRLDRLIETVGFMLHYKITLRRLHADLFPGIKIKLQLPCPHLLDQTSNFKDKDSDLEDFIIIS